MSEQSEKKKKMLEAAGELFSQKGYYNSSMKDVADRAGVAVGTIYLYFKTKEDLLDGIYDYASSTLLERIENGLRPIESPEEKLGFFIKESIEFGLVHPYFFLIVFVDFRRWAVEFPKSIMFRFFQKYLGIGNTIIAEIRGRNQIQDESDVLFGITGFWGAYVLREIFQPGFARQSRKKARDEIYRLCENTILRGLADM